jgi:hypothetical protein
MPENLIKKIRTSEGDLQIDYNALANLPDLSAVGVQPDWNETDETAKSFIKNKTHYVDANGTVHRLNTKYMPLGVVTNVAVSNITGGHRVTLTTNNGTKTIDVMDGKNGANGANGKDGAAGKDGITPSIGANGNWYTGTTDTGVSASGLQANADWNQEDDTAADYIKNKPLVGLDYITMRDVENGVLYTLQFVNGNLVSFCQIERIEITTMPLKTTYVIGSKFNPTGMVVSAIYADGSTKVIDSYEYSSDYFDKVGNTDFEITYTERGKEYKTTINLTITEFDPNAEELRDFTYSKTYVGSGKYKYSIDGWNGTLNGDPSTIMALPDNNLLILYS